MLKNRKRKKILRRNKDDQDLPFAKIEKLQ